MLYVWFFFVVQLVKVAFICLKLERIKWTKPTQVKQS